MKFNKNAILTSFSLLVLILAGTITLEKTVFKKQKTTIIMDNLLIKLNKSQLIGLTDTVALGTVKNIQSFATSSQALPGEKEVYSNVTFEIEASLYNPKDMPSGEVIIQVPGGEIDKTKMISTEDTPLELNHKYVVFLKQKENDQAFIIPAGPQGVFEVNKDGNLGVGAKQQMLIQNIFGHNLNLNELRDELNTAKPEPIPGQKNN